MAPVAIPGLGNREDVPRPNPAANPVTAGLTAQEGWVFSRVDGHTSFAELFLITGLGEPQTVEILKTLVARGLVIAGNGALPTPQPRPATRPPVSAPQQPARVPTRPPVARVPTPPPAARPATPPPAARPATPPPAARPATPPPASTARGELEAARAAAAAAEETARNAAAMLERAQAEEAAAQAAVRECKEALAKAEATVRDSDGVREAARRAEEEARASVQALRDSLVRAEIELTRRTTERERVNKDIAGSLEQVTAARQATQQAMAHAELAKQALERAAAAAQDTREQADEKSAVVRRAEELADRTLAERRQREEAERKADLESMLKGYAAQVDRPVAKPAREPEPVRHETMSPKIAPPDTGECDLPDEIRRRVTRKHVQLATQDLFELLEVPIDCDKKAVKKAYFKLSKEFHPDRHFGRKLGPFKQMLADIFKAISQASEFLSDDARRDEYRTMIRTQHEIRELEAALAKATAAALEEERAQEQPPAEEAAFAASPSEARASGGGKWARKGSGEYPVSPPPSARGPSKLVRQVISRNLNDERADKAVKHFEEAGRQAAQGQWVSAAHNYKLAATFAPENAEYAARLREAESKSAEMQAATHFKRADFEERAGRYDAAARCYEQAARLYPIPAACLKAVEMFLKIRELKKAIEYGIKAVDLDRASPAGHLALAQVYREAKQLTDAKRSLERALELDPNNKVAQDLMKEVQKG